MSIATDTQQDFLDAIERVASEVAAPHADEVDRGARFPAETLDALREAGALSAFVPTELGGGGVPFEALAEACLRLGRRCGASAMVFAMHQIQVATMVRHLVPGSWFESYLSELAREQRLVASVTSEVGTGGDMGRSVAAVTPGPDGRLSFEKRAPTVSYGRHCDDLFVTLRRAPDAEPGDQVVVLVRREQIELEPTGEWDPIGMRGTCSPGFVVRAAFGSDQVLDDPFARVSAESMTPISHILWSHLWLGLATDAFERARAFVRAAAKRTPGQTPPAAQRLSHVMSDLSLLRGEVHAALRDFLEGSEGDRAKLSTMSSALRFNNLKISASEQAPRICQGALGVAGMAGFQNNTPYSVGRQLRDTMSAHLMVANERIHQTNAGLLLIAKEV
jgi:acyl-CoA dehydrogenase